jgi:1-acyl-sn-glycerol-3-phosphate acyltransferase
MILLVAVRSALFALVQIVTTPVFAIVGLLTFPLPLAARYRVISTWSRLMVIAVRMICGIRYVVRGRENIPDAPCIVMSKHQSAWETLVFQVIFPPQVWVLKRELLWVPFFGWGLAMLAPIAIDRKSGRKALKQMLEQGADRLARGFWIVMFPEGTRVAPGHRGTYHIGGAWLANRTGTAVLPIAHNAGHFWRRQAFLKYPGTVTISIGPLMRPDGTPDELNTRVSTWIEDEVARLDP